jgi:hypothetical protein
MACWWRKIAVLQGATAGSGSWKRRVALAAVVPVAGDSGSWPRIRAKGSGAVRQLSGSWTRRMTPTTARGSSWARNLFNAGGPN